MPNTSAVQISAVPTTDELPTTGEVPTTGEGSIPGTPTAVMLRLPTTRHAGPAKDSSFTIDCADCRHQDTPVCDDCVVSFIVGRRPEDAVVVDADEARAVRMLEHAGLVPGVRHSLQAAQ